MTTPPSIPNWNFSDIKVGQEFLWEHTVTAEEVEHYRRLSGDENPLHLDAEFARQLGYKDRVVYGGLEMAYLSRMLGVQFPGPGAVWLSQQLRFESPVYIGDRLVVRVRVQQKNDHLGALSLAVEIAKGERKTLTGSVVVQQPKKNAPNPNGSSICATGEATVTVPVRRNDRKTGDAVALVTGAGRGIGAAVAEALGRRGMRVAVNFFSNEASAQKTAEAVARAGGEARAIRADITTAAGVRDLFETTIETFGRVDVVVNNAGTPIEKKELAQLSATELERYFALYVGSAFELARLAAPEMRERSYGRIINILSSSLIGPPPIGWTAYVTAKSALMGLSRSLAVELAPWGITCNMVSPSLVPTELWSGLSENQLRATALRNPTRRLAGVRDVADTVAFLAGPESQHINGVNIPVTGGEAML